jgi:hypothetical protein
MFPPADAGSVAAPVGGRKFPLPTWGAGDTRRRFVLRTAGVERRRRDGDRARWDRDWAAFGRFPARASPRRGKKARPAASVLLLRENMSVEETF